VHSRRSTRSSHESRDKVRRSKLSSSADKVARPPASRRRATGRRESSRPCKRPSHPFERVRVCGCLLMLMSADRTRDEPETSSPIAPDSCAAREFERTHARQAHRASGPTTTARAYRPPEAARSRARAERRENHTHRSLYALEQQLRERGTRWWRGREVGGSLRGRSPQARCSGPSPRSRARRQQRLTPARREAMRS